MSEKPYSLCLEYGTVTNSRDRSRVKRCMSLYEKKVKNFIFLPGIRQHDYCWRF